MNIMPANRASENTLAHFLDRNKDIKKESLLYSGYVVEVEGAIEGCFSLEQMEEGIFWLKQLYITQTHAARLPYLLEGILTLVKRKQAKVIYVHSHQPVIDLLLEALQFNPQKESVFSEEYPITQGNWWSYKVS
ncbi:hypothetical protein ACLIBG_04700 [Virgibacillus sp. W0181]|uniref:hypothetical protein n=1 Tax=Virgibacillus sp. W0181 TaxID=3391581 RepID=UPI003F475E77